MLWRTGRVRQGLPRGLHFHLRPPHPWVRAAPLASPYWTHGNPLMGRLSRGLSLRQAYKELRQEPRCHRCPKPYPESGYKGSSPSSTSLSLRARRRLSIHLSSLRLRGYLEDAPFLPCDLLHCVPQKASVVNAERRDPTYHRLPAEDTSVTKPLPGVTWAPGHHRSPQAAALT